MGKPLHRFFCFVSFLFAGFMPTRVFGSADSLKVVRLYQTSLDIVFAAGDLRLDSFLLYAEQGRSLARQLHMLTYVSDFNTYIAYGYKRVGQFDKAAYFSTIAYREALSINYIQGIARSGYTRAMICFDKGDIKPSFEQISSNLEFARKNHLDRYLFSNYILLSAINARTPNKMITDHYQEKAFEYHENMNMRNAFRIKSELCLAILEGRESDQEKLYREFRSLPLNYTEIVEEINLLLDIANAYFQAGKVDKALEIFKELRDMNNHDVQYPETSIDAALAVVYLSLREFDKAEAINPKADRITRHLYYDTDYVTILKTDARLKEHKGQFHEALKVWREIGDYQDSIAHVSNEISYYLVKNLKDLESLESKFESMRKQNTMQQLLLEKERREKILLLVLTVILVMLCGWIYYLFRRLSYSNRKIREQNTAISVQTESLRKSNFIKDKLFSLMSHELRSPIAELITILDVHEWKNKGSALHPHLISVNRKAKNIYTTLDNILTWSSSQLKNEEAEMTAMDISTVVNTAIQLNQQEINRKDIRIDNQAVPVEIQANMNYLTIIFRNILHNAVKFTPANGSIRIYSMEEDGYAGVIIEDSGTGIEPDKLRSLFVSVQDSIEGTTGEKGSGVGLILCKDLVDKLQGKIEISNAPYGGASVKLLFMKTVRADR